LTSVRRSRLCAGILFCVVVASVAITVLPGHAAAGTLRAGATAAGARPTLAQLEADIASSVQLKAGPNVATSIPPLLSMTPVDVSSLAMNPSCYSDSVTSVPSNFSKLCAWGSKTATRTIFLFGDSQAAQWVPALNALGIDLGWKVIMVGRSQCSPWVDPNKLYYTGTSLAACIKFRAEEFRAIDKTHPAVVIPDGLELDYGVGKYATPQQFLAELQTMATALAPSGAKLVFLSPLPGFYPDFTNQTPVTCLTAHASDIQPCLYSPTQMVSYELLEGFKQIAASTQGAVANVTPLFCTTTKCAIFVKAGNANHLVYFDQYHTNRWYSVWISRALDSILGPLLPVPPAT
jgi:SGNH domain (fused to AT3 domains)